MPDRSIAPPVEEPSKFELVHAKTRILNSGIALHIIHMGTLPLIKLEFIFRSGTWFESMPGVAFFTATMLPEGTIHYSSKDISLRFDRSGAFLEIHPGPDYSSIVVYAVKRHMENILPIIRELIYDPVFPEKELDVLKKLQFNNLQISKEKNSYLAYTKFREVLFGINHPYGRLLDEEIIERQNQEMLRPFHQSHFPGNFEIVLSGMAGDDVIELMEKTFLSGPKVRLMPFQKINLHRNIEKVHVPKENSLQAAIRIGHVTIKKDHPDFVKLMLTNELFGGYFGSRLMQNIREDKGYTYGIHSSIASFREAGYFSIAADVKKEFITQTIKEIHKEIRILREEKVPEEELAKVRNHIKGNYLSSITTPFSIAEKFKNIHFYGLDYSFYDHLFDRIDEVTPDDILTTAGRYLNPEEMSEVVVG